MFSFFVYLEPESYRSVLTIRWSIPIDSNKSIAECFKSVSLILLSSRVIFLKSSISDWTSPTEKMSFLESANSSIGLVTLISFSSTLNFLIASYASCLTMSSGCFRERSFSTLKDSLIMSGHIRTISLINLMAYISPSIFEPCKHLTISGV